MIVSMSFDALINAAFCIGFGIIGIMVILETVVILCLDKIDDKEDI